MSANRQWTRAGAAKEHLKNKNKTALNTKLKQVRYLLYIRLRKGANPFGVSETENEHVKILSRGKKSL